MLLSLAYALFRVVLDLLCFRVRGGGTRDVELLGSVTGCASCAGRPGGPAGNPVTGWCSRR